MFLSSGRYLENEAFFYNNTEMKNNKDERILGVIFENKLKFKSHTSQLKVKLYVRKLPKRPGLSHV